MKKYVFEVIVEEGNDEFWENLEKTGSTGCEDIFTELVDAISGSPLVNTTIILREFTNKE